MSTFIDFKTLRILVAVIPVSIAYPAAADRSEVVQAEIDTIGQYLESHPEMVIDLRKVSGEFCFNTWAVGGHHMTHYAVDPSATREDMIDFVPVGPMQGAVDVTKLPRFPGKLGSMEPNQWYYLPAGELEPHHGKKFPFPLLLRATDIE